MPHQAYRIGTKRYRKAGLDRRRHATDLDLYFYHRFSL
jgi:hypothetical protein